MTSIAPDTPPSTRSAVWLLCTMMEPTSSDGSSEKLLLRPTEPPNWFSTNQSPVLMAWPLNRVCCRLGLVPRRLTRSFSPKPPSPPAEDWMFTPGRRWMASATFLSGILPMSSAVTTSTTESALRFCFSDCSSAARTPDTVMTAPCSGAGACWAWPGSAAPSISRPMAAAIGVRRTAPRLFAFNSTLITNLQSGPGTGLRFSHECRSRHGGAGRLSPCMTNNRTSSTPIYCNFKYQSATSLINI